MTDKAWLPRRPIAFCVQLVAVLLLGLSTAAVCRAADTLVSAGASWRYLDDGSDQGSAWRNPGFDDTGWASGAAQLGYGDGDEATMVGYGPDPRTSTSPPTSATPSRSPTPRLYRGARHWTCCATTARSSTSTASRSPATTCPRERSATRPRRAPRSAAPTRAPFNRSPLRPGLSSTATTCWRSRSTRPPPTSSDISFDLELIGDTSATRRARALPAEGHARPASSCAGAPTCRPTHGCATAPIPVAARPGRRRRRPSTPSTR